MKRFMQFSVYSLFLSLFLFTSAAYSKSTQEETSKEANKEETVSEQQGEVATENEDSLESLLALLPDNEETKRFREEVLDLLKEKARLSLENQLLQEKNSHQLAELAAETERLGLERDRLQLKYELFEQQQKQELAKTEAEKNRLILENDLKEQLIRQEVLKVELRVAKPEYRLEPYENEQLIISDRRIVLDEYITYGVADYITQRIDYFNNKDPKYPIFLIIDACLGGSVLEGARIIEAMKNSQAPIYVVVKSLAASMGAIITAQAKKSFAYPNALFIHHQLALMVMGNTSQANQQLKITQEWSKRTLQPIAERMGLSMDDFTKKMYENNVDGNWTEFATDAQKLKWVDHIVSDIRETSYIKNPDQLESPLLEDENEPSTREATFSVEGRLKKKTAKELPSLLPGDFYYLVE